VAERPARRFLHVCYCCDDASVVTDFFVNNFKMKNTMRTTDQYSSGAILGIDRDVRSVGSFVYDQRGPRTSPAIEIQGWFDPAPVGQPSTDPFRIGIKSLGLSVPNIEAALDSLISAGCRVLSRSASVFDTKVASVIDPNDVTLEIVEDEKLPITDTRMHHLRLTITDIETSLPFYENLGFVVLSRGAINDGAFLGITTPVEGEFVRLRLPDEPFELRLIQWMQPTANGKHYKEPFHRGIFRVALGVDDTRSAYEEMCSNGAIFDRPPMQVELSGTPVPDMWITFISDPDSIAYEFVQRPRSAFR